MARTARDDAHAMRFRVLFLLPFAPRVDARHGGRATAAVVSRLAARHDVAVLYLRAPDEGPADAALAERCAVLEEVRLPARPSASRRARLLWSVATGRPMQVADTADRGFSRRVRSLAGEFRPDLVHLELERMAWYLDAVDGSTAARVLVAVEAAAEAAHDVHRAASGIERIVRYLDWRAWTRFEKASLAAVDTVVCHTDRDGRVLAAAAPADTPIERIPLRVELPEQPLNPVGSDSGVVFVGGFGHPPNADAARRLAANIFPLVRERCSDAVLYLVGDKPPDEVRRLAGDAVIVTGRVDDVTPYLDGAAVVVAPLRLGGGTRIKVLEALAFGKAVVASPLAAEGVDARDGEHVILAETDTEFADAAVRLLEDPSARANLGARARGWAEATLDWEQTVAQYERVYRLAFSRARERERQGGG